MSKFTLPLAASLVALGFAFGPASTADAQGIHYRSRGIHIDIGNPHGHYGRGYSGHPRSQYHRGDWGARYHSSFHGRRGHLHYYPPQVVRHYDHYHVVPGHHHYHRGGHYPW